VLLLPSLVGACTCSTEPKPKASRCDLGALEAAVAELPGHGPEQRKVIVASSILNACPEDALRPYSRELLPIASGRLASADRTFTLPPPTEVKLLWAKVCPDGATCELEKLPADERGPASYDACGWESLDLLSREEMKNDDAALGVVWAYYPILRELGVPHELCRPLMRVLILDGLRSIRVVSLFGSGLRPQTPKKAVFNVWAEHQLEGLKRRNSAQG